MTLTEFLAQTAYVVGTNPPIDITTLTDEAALQQAKDYAENTYRKIGGNEARQFFAMFGAIRKMEAVLADVTPVQIITGVDTTLGELAQAVLDTLQDSSSRFATDPTLEEGQLNRAASQALVTNNVLLQSTIDAFFNLSVVNNTPLSNTTLEQVKAIRYPAVLTACSHGGQDFVVSISNKDLFSFVTTTNEPISNTQLTMYWREDATAVWKQYQSPFVLTGGNGVLSQVIRKPSGLNAARHFKFEYTPNHVGQIASITASVGQ